MSQPPGRGYRIRPGAAHARGNQDPPGERKKGGRTCLCDGGPVCRHHHHDKQAPGWHLQHGDARGCFTWTTATGRTHPTKPTQYPD